MTNGINRNHLAGGLALLLLLLAVSCAGSNADSLTGQDLLQPAAAPGANQLPAPAELERQLSQIEIDMPAYLTGDAYCEFLPSSGAAKGLDHSLLLSPDAQASGTAFAMYATAFDNLFGNEPALEPRLLVKAGQAQPDDALYLMLPDYSSGRWELHPLQFDEASGLHQADFGDWEGLYHWRDVIVFAVLASGGTERSIQSLRFGSGFAPAVAITAQQDSRQATGAGLTALISLKQDADPQFGGISKVEVDFDNDGTLDAEAVQVPGGVTWQRYEAAGHVIPGPGIHEMRVVIRSGSGASFEATERYIHGTEGTSEPVADLVSSGGLSGGIGGQFILDASGSTAGEGPIVRYFWTIDGHAVAESTSPFFSHAFSQLGSYRIRLTVMDELYNTDQATLELSVSADGAGWTHLRPANAAEFSELFNSDYGFAAISGRPALAFRDPLSGIRYIRAQDSRGSSWPAEFSTALPDPLAEAGQICGLLEVGGLPAIFYVNHDNSDAETPYSLRRIMAHDASGTAWGPVHVCFKSAVEPSCRQFLTIGGRPCILDNHPGASGLALLLAGDTAGDVWEPAQQLPDHFGNAEDIPLLADWEGLPCAAYLDTTDNVIRFSAAQQPEAASWTQPFDVLEGGSDFLQLVDLAIINGQPVIAAFGNRPGCPELLREMAYSRCIHALGAAWSEPVYFYGHTYEGHGELLDYNGVPALATVGTLFEGNPQLNLAVARDPSGSSWNSPVAMHDYIDGGFYSGASAPALYAYEDVAIMCSGRPLAFVRTGLASFAWYE
ncbi:MAG: PKD domain-containing protein [bacterium]